VRLTRRHIRPHAERRQRRKALVVLFECIGIQKRLILSRATTSSAAALKGVEHMAAAGRR